MKKTTVLWTLSLLVSLSAGATAGERVNRSGHSADLTLVDRMEAPPQAAQAKPSTWSSRAEYDAYNAFFKEAPAKLIPLAEAFLQKYPNSFMKADVQVRLMTAYAQTNDMAKADGAAKKVLEADPDNLDALAFLSYVFPFTFKAEDPEAAAKLSRADGDARHGLDVLQKLQKPATVTDEQFKQFVAPKRALFNSTVGFVALQRKDYATAITALKAAAADNPSDVYNFYRLGLAYLYSTPPDSDHAIWYIARAVALAQAPPKNPAADDISAFLKRAYVNYHGTDTGLSDIITQAATSVDPPEGFKVAPLEAPKPTGNKVIDAFNDLTFPLKLGGETAQKQWDAIKGQPVGLGGTVASVEKGADPNVFLVRIAMLDSTKSADGYDIELKDSTQPNVKNLEKGELVTFKGTADSYTATPSLILTLVGEVTSELPEKPAAKPKPPVRKPPAKPKPPTNN